MIVTRNTQQVLSWIPSRDDFFDADRCVSIAFINIFYEYVGDDDDIDSIYHHTNGKKNQILCDL